MNKKKYSLVSFFAGVGGIEYGFEQTGGFETIWANEIDQFASKTYKSNFRSPLVTTDIREVDADSIPKADVFVGGFPCQAFSIAGYRKGFEDKRGNLFFEILRVVVTHKPRVVFLENVKNLVGHNNGNTYRVIKESLEAHGYQVKKEVLNAKDYGNIPQNRERIYIVAFLDKKDWQKFDFNKLDTIPLTTSISDLLDNKIDEKYIYRADKTIIFDSLNKEVNKENVAYQWRRKYVRSNKSGVFPTLTANMGTGGHNVPIVYHKKKIRKLTPRECFRVQGFGDNYRLPEISDAQLYKQAGNSVVVPVIERIAYYIYSVLQETDKEKEKLSNSENLLGF